MYGEEQIISRLARLIKLSEQYIIERAEGLGLSRVHAKYLAALSYCPNITLTDLSRQLDLDKAHTTRAVSKLLKMGYITKKKAADNRAFVLNLTQSGKQKADLILKEITDYLTDLTGNVDKEQLQTFFSVLDTISENATKLLGN